MVGGEVEERQDAGAGVPAEIHGRRREGGGECSMRRRRRGPEVSVEDLTTDLGAGDDVADRQLVDRMLVCQFERGVPETAADPFGAGIDTVGACCHIRSVDRVRRQLTTKD